MSSGPGAAFSWFHLTELTRAAMSLGENNEISSPVEKLMIYFVIAPLAAPALCQGAGQRWAEPSHLQRGLTSGSSLGPGWFGHSFWLEMIYKPH